MAVDLEERSIDAFSRPDIECKGLVAHPGEQFQATREADCSTLGCVNILVA